MRKANLLTWVCGTVLVSALSIGSAQAQAVCEAEKTLSAKVGAKYQEADTALYVEESPQKALSILNQIRQMPDLTCFERGAILGLSAGVKNKLGDMPGVAKDLEEAIAIGFIEKSEIPKTYLNIGQVYASVDNLAKAKEYLEKWLAAGGTPTRDQNYLMAGVYTKLDDFNKALPFAERVFRADGANVKNDIIDFMIFLYDRTGNRAKKAEMLEFKLSKNPTDLNTWRAIAGEYFQAGDERKAFEVYKAMYVGGLLTQEDDIMRIVNFYNRFNAPYESAKVLEKEINKGTIKSNLQRLDQLANLYQVAREYDKAIPVIQRAAELSSDGSMYERLGRSNFELKNYEKAIDAFQKALNKGGLKTPGQAYLLIGQAYYELDKRDDARKAFADAQKYSDGRNAGRSWIQFMDAEEATAKALVLHQAATKLEGLQNEKKGCEKLKVLGTNLPDSCDGIDGRVEEALKAYTDLGGKI